MPQDHRYGASASHGAFVYFPAKAGTHLPTPEGWKAESLGANKIEFLAIHEAVKDYIVFMSGTVIWFFTRFGQVEYVHNTPWVKKH